MAASPLAVQDAVEMVGQRFTHRRHPEIARQRVAFSDVPSPGLSHHLRRRSQVDCLGREINLDASLSLVHGAGENLHDSRRLTQHQFDATARLGPEIPGFGVERRTTPPVLGGLLERNEWFPHMAERQRLGVGERLDRRVRTLSRPLPGAKERDERSIQRVQVRSIHHAET